MNIDTSASTIYTIDYHNLTEDQFQNILLDNAVATLIDIRSQPRSSLQPYFNEEPQSQYAAMPD